MTTTTSTTTTLYPGAYRAAIARAKRVLVAAGLPWSRTTGRYSPFGGSQRTTKGVRVTRVGVSKTVSLHVFGCERHEGLELTARALKALREAGLPFDDRGWLECRYE